MRLAGATKQEDLHITTLTSLIDIFGGARGIYASIENPGYMRLVIEAIGVGPRGHRAISIAHYFELNGDLCQEPEMGLELVPQADGSFTYEPFFFQMAIPPIYQEVYTAGPETENLLLKQELTKFLRIWDPNLAGQGFIAAAQKQREFCCDAGSSSSSSFSVRNGGE